LTLPAIFEPALINTVWTASSPPSFAARLSWDLLSNRGFLPTDHLSDLKKFYRQVSADEAQSAVLKPVEAH
jgi:hypothetical protein